MNHRMTSTFNTAAMISYVRRRRPGALPSLLAGLHEPLGVEPEQVEGILNHSSGLAPLEVFTEMARRVREDIFHDPQAAYRVAFEGMAFHAWGPLKSLFLRFLGTPANLVRVAPWFIGRFSRSVEKIIPSDMGPRGCTLRVRWRQDPPRSHDHCLFLMGALAALPLCFGRHPARIKQEGCFFEGRDECIYKMSWDPLSMGQRLHTLLWGANGHRARFLVDSLNEHVRQVELLNLQSEEMARALAQEQKRFQILAEHSPLGLAFLDARGRFVYTNPAFGRMFGYHGGRALDSRAWLRRAYPDESYRRQVVAAWKADLAACGEGQVRERTFRVSCADGSAKDVLFRAVGLAGGEQLVVMEDVTRRLAAEREFKRSEARLRKVVEGSPDAIFLLDQQGKVLMANRMAARLFADGLPPQGKGWLELLPPRRLSWGRDLLAWVERGKVAREEVELPVAEGAGLGIFELMAISLEPGRTFLSLRDIGHRRRLDQQRQEAARLAGVVELAGTAAHELNQPLTSLLASSEMMLLYSDPADLKRQARRMRDDALKLAKLVERFGRIVRYETKEYLPGKHIIDLERAAMSPPEGEPGGRLSGKSAKSLDGRTGNG